MQSVSSEHVASEYVRYLHAFLHWPFTTGTEAFDAQTHIAIVSQADASVAAPFVVELFANHAGYSDEMYMAQLRVHRGNAALRSHMHQESPSHDGWLEYMYTHRFAQLWMDGRNSHWVHCWHSVWFDPRRSQAKVHSSEFESQLQTWRLVHVSMEPICAHAFEQ